MKPLISVIVPVYNVEEYLRECLDSILSQSYDNIEVILVDDGSTDRSGSICDEYEDADNRVMVVHTENRGLSAARNMGLDMMRGKFVFFVDSDDVLLPEALSTLYQLIISNKADIAIGNICRTMPKGNARKKAARIVRYSAREAIADSLYQHRLLNAAWAKLYNTDLFDGTRFREGILYEDLDLIYRLFGNSRCIVYTSQPIYFYRIRSGSLVMEFIPQRLDVLDVADRIEQHLKDWEPTLVPAARDRKLSASFNMYWLMSINHAELPDQADRCWQNIRNLRMASLMNPHVRFKNKVGILLSMCGRPIFTAICRNVKRMPGQ